MFKKTSKFFCYCKTSEAQTLLPTMQSFPNPMPLLLSTLSIFSAKLRLHNDFICPFLPSLPHSEAAEKLHPVTAMLRFGLPIPCIHPSLPACIQPFVWLCYPMLYYVIPLSWTTKHNGLARIAAGPAWSATALAMDLWWWRICDWRFQGGSMDGLWVNWGGLKLRHTKKWNLSFTSLLYNNLFMYLFF